MLIKIFKKKLEPIQGENHITRRRISMSRSNISLSISNDVDNTKKNTTMEILNEFDIKSDTQLQKTLQRTTMKMLSYETVSNLYILIT